MYDPKYTKTFYNAYGEFEWARLEATPFGRLQAIIHEDFILRYLKSGDRVLDAGCGPGRFSISVARAGGRVTALDISDKQLEIAKEKIAAAGLIDQIEQFIEGDICDLSMFEDGQFDMVICYGGALSYVCEKHQKAAAELMRVTKRGGVILVSVMSRLGTVQGVARLPYIPSLETPDISGPGVPGLWEVVEKGEFPGFPSRAGLMHAPMHLYTAEELKSLFKKCRILEVAGSNVTIPEAPHSGEQIATSPTAWATLVELEKKINHDPGLVNCGSHIIMAVKK
ncbi:MAG: class I SAM-dependent methyltransferase [Dehalococcoidales bacterium]